MIESEKIKDYYKKTVNKNTNDIDGFLRQVGKTFLGETINENSFRKIVLSIIKNLKLSSKDKVIDLGCANGLITSSISESVEYIYGFDLSADLIDVAKKFQQKDNISYSTGDIMNVDFSKYGVENIFMYEVLQHFEYSMLRQLLNKLILECNTFSLLIGSIPDRELMLSFYNTTVRKKYLFTKLLESNENHLGNWWYKEHILLLCEELGLNATIIEQDKELHTAHYRFDVLIEKI